MVTRSDILGTYAFAIRVVEGLELNDVGMANNSHDLEFTVLWDCQFHRPRNMPSTDSTNLEALVLKYTLDGSIFVGR